MSGRAADAPTRFPRIPRGGAAFRAALRRNRCVITLVLPLSLLLGILATMLTTPRFRAEATVQIASPPARRGGPGDRAEARRSARTQLDILRSGALRRRVADDLGLARDGDFVSRMRTTSAAWTADGKHAPNDRVVGLLEDNVEIALPDGSSIARIAFTSPDPALSARIANGFAQSYVLFDLQRRYETAARYRLLLDAPLADARHRLEDAERALAGNARPRTSETRSADTGELDRTNSAYASARGDRIAAEKRWQAIRTADPMAMPEVLRDRHIQSLVERLQDARAAYRRLQRKPDADPVKLRRAATRTATFEGDITAAIAAIKRPARDAYDTALRRERDMFARRDAMKREVAQESARRARDRMLTREADTSRALYEGLLARYRAVDQAASLDTSGPAIIDAATPPRHPISPKPFLDMTVALTVGLLVAAAAVVVRETLSGPIRTPSDIRERLGPDVLAVVPRPSGTRPLAEALADPRSRISEAYHRLRIALDLSSPDGAPRSLLFVGVRGAEGASTSAMAIARQFAEAGRTVVLIDANLRAGWLHRPFGAGNVIGLSTLLSRNAEPGQAVQDTDHANLTLIASGPPPPDPVALLAGPLLRSILDDLSGRYDIVLIDGPPAGVHADAALIARAVERVVLVAEARRSRIREARRALTHLMAAHARLVGAILTKADVRGPSISG